MNTNLDNRKKNFYTIVALSLMICWMGLIFYFSSRTGDVSSAQSNQVQEMILNTMPGIKEMYLKLNGSGLGIFSIRKIAHMFLYFTLAILAYAVFYIRTQQFKIGIKGAMFISVIYAALDEVHQLYVVGRSGQLTDVWVDSIGVLVAILLIAIITLVKRKKLSKTE